MSLGKLLTPQVVKRLTGSGRVDTEGALLAAAGVAVLLYATFSTLSAPVGALAWSWSIQFTSAPLAVAVSATALLIASAGLAGLNRRVNEPGDA